MLVFLIYILGSIIAFFLSLHVLYYYSKNNSYIVKYQRSFFEEESPFIIFAFIFSWVGVLGCLMCYIGILFNKFINYLSNKWFNE